MHRSELTMERYDDLARKIQYDLRESQNIIPGQPGSAGDNQWSPVTKLRLREKKKVSTLDPERVQCKEHHKLE